MWWEKVVYVVSYITIILGVYKAVTSTNPVLAVLYLILAFLAICGFLIYISMDYLAVLFVLIYGGAISILIMFVIMMLDIKELEVRGKVVVRFLNFLVLFFSCCCICYLVSIPQPIIERYLGHNYGYKNVAQWANYKSNIEVVGIVLFEHYIFPFIMVGFLLFIAMVAVIALVIRSRRAAKTQILYEQLKRSNLKMIKVR